jgi:DsbC/DsbD-like thiol-disulfide interchange protein
MLVLSIETICLPVHHVLQLALGTVMKPDSQSTSTIQAKKRQNAHLVHTPDEES